jgi:putative endonuclease
MAKDEMATHNDIGQWGERLVAEYLLKKGYSICHRNWKIGRRDLDIVALSEDRDMLVVVEVKTRSNNTYTSPEEAVDWRKKHNLIVAANAYVQRYQMDMPVRFDIITVTGKEDDAVINHIENAFVPVL